MFETEWQLFKAVRDWLGNSEIKYIWEMLKRNKITDDEINNIIQESYDKERPEALRNWRYFIRGIKNKNIKDVANIIDKLDEEDKKCVLDFVNDDNSFKDLNLMYELIKIKLQ